VRSLRPQLPRERDVGRALRLLMINVGRARPGEISMSTFGHPGRYTFCIGENEEASPRPPFHAGRGLPAGTSALYSHTMLVVGPEHARTFAEADGRRTISSGTSMTPCGDRIGRSCP